MDIEATISERGHEMAERHTLADLAVLVAECAPKRRNKWAAEARIPWDLIYAIRQRSAAGNR